MHSVSLELGSTVALSVLNVSRVDCGNTGHSGWRDMTQIQFIVQRDQTANLLKGIETKSPQTLSNGCQMLVSHNVSRELDFTVLMGITLTVSRADS